MISIIIPVYNEGTNIKALIEELYCVLKNISSFEIIFVDDGSKDDTLARIKECSQIFNNLYYVSFSKNFGHQNALRAGFNVCRGNAVISMDGDLQHPPKLILQMITKWQEGYDVVYTTRQESQDIGPVKKYTSLLFYRILNFISKTEVPNGAADFRLLDRKVVEAIKQIQENDVFYRGVIAWVGFKQYELNFCPQPRKTGKSKYSLYKMLKFGLTGITSFSVFPLRVSALSGFAIAGLSFGYALYAFAVKLLSNQAVSGWASIMTGIYFLGGIQLIAIGICGEYIGKILLEVKNRPAYIVSESSLPTLSDDQTCNRG